MFKKGPIPAFVHGFLDYVLAALLIAAPFLFGFEDDGATATAIVAGVIVLIIGACTAWTTGIIKSIPRTAHALLDYVVAILLIAAPFLFAFQDDGTATAFFIIAGVADLLLAIATRFTPQPSGRAPAGRPA
jgi:branched-subunit amino acid transport protein